MVGSQLYRTGAQAVLLAARDLQEAVDAKNVDDLPSLANGLLMAALAREARDPVAGFLAEPPEPDRPEANAPPPLDEQLSVALAEVEVGEVLLAGAAALDLPERGGPA